MADVFLSYSSADRELTRGLDAELVASGVRLPNGFAPNPVCCPSRSSILSGQYSHNNGVLQNRVAQEA